MISPDWFATASRRGPSRSPANGAGVRSSLTHIIRCNCSPFLAWADGSLSFAAHKPLPTTLLSALDAIRTKLADDGMKQTGRLTSSIGEPTQPSCLMSILEGLCIGSPGAGWAAGFICWRAHTALLLDVNHQGSGSWQPRSKWGSPRGHGSLPGNGHAQTTES